MTAGTTGIFTLLGVLLGSRLNARLDHAKWLREQKQQAYSSFLADSGLGNLDLILDGTILESEYLAKQLVHSQRITILAPIEITELAQDVVTVAKKIARKVGNLPKEEKARVLGGLGDEYTTAVGRLTFAMKLDLHKLPRRERLGVREYLKETAEP
ncbi:hypothetical protein [Pseudarthrobacter equi]|nr:hypothetical protein [Pseudarthrobacter equi]